MSFYVISGTVSGVGGPGALVEPIGATSASVTANEAGQYHFIGLTNGSYTITPTKHGCVMTPKSQAVTVNGANATATFSTALITH